MEIVTWVLDGELAHRDSTGTVGIIYPGLAQRMSAGSGIQHSEMNASATADVHLVQMWVLPDTQGIEPGYEQRDLNDALAAAVWSSSRPDRDTTARCRSTSATPCCRRDASVPARRSWCPTRRTCTCSSPWATLARRHRARNRRRGAPHRRGLAVAHRGNATGPRCSSGRRREHDASSPSTGRAARPANGDTSGPQRRTTVSSSASRPAARGTRWSTSWSLGAARRRRARRGLRLLVLAAGVVPRAHGLRRRAARSGTPPRPTVRRGCATASHRSGAVRAGPDPTCPRTCATRRPRSPRSAGSARSRRSRSAAPAASAPVRSAASPPWPDCRMPASRSGRSTHRRRHRSQSRSGPARSPARS